MGYKQIKSEALEQIKKLVSINTIENLLNTDTEFYHEKKKVKWDIVTVNLNIHPIQIEEERYDYHNCGPSSLINENEYKYDLENIIDLDQLSLLSIKKTSNYNIYNQYWEIIEEINKEQERLCGKWNLVYSIKKLEHYKRIIFNSDDKLLISKELFSKIHYVIEESNHRYNRNMDFDKHIEKIDLESLIEFTVGAEDNINNIWNLWLFLYSISESNLNCVAKLISYLLIKLDEDLKKSLVRSVETDDNIILLENNESKIESNFIKLNNGKIAYKRIKKENIAPKYTVWLLEYNIENSILKFWEKYWNFSWWDYQRIMMEILYQNLNSPVNKKLLKEKWVPNPDNTFKEIRIKLEEQKMSFSPLETRTLLTSFTYNKEKYFVMHW